MDCADLITVQIRDGKNVPETFPQLYQLFEKWYTEREKKVPEQRHFIRKMREELGVESGKKKIQPYLYAFVGKYDKMSLELLAEGTTLSRVSNASWLFVRLRSKISSTTDKKNAHFYYLSRKLKEKFPQDILFLSFDVDVIGLYPLMPDKMKVDRDEKNRLIYIYSRYDEANPNLKQQGDIVLQAEDVLHIPGLGYDGLVGYSPIALAKNAIGISIACEDYGASFFGNNANPSGVLEHPGVIKNPDKLRDAWHRAYGGRNAHKVAVLEEGVKFTPISIPNNEAQFLETRKFQIEEIARMYRVPLHMIGDLDHATFSNVEHLSLDFVKYSLDPWIVRWEQSLQKDLLSDSEKGRYFIKFNVDGLLRGDYASRMQGYATARQNGWMSANDIRELEDMNMLSDEEGGNLYLVNGSFTKLADAGAFANQNSEKEKKTK